MTSWCVGWFGLGWVGWCVGCLLAFGRPLVVPRFAATLDMPRELMPACYMARTLCFTFTNSSFSNKATFVLLFVSFCFRFLLLFGLFFFCFLVLFLVVCVQCFFFSAACRPLPATPLAYVEERKDEMYSL